MRVAFALGGTDLGKSGIGIYVREVLPRLSKALSESGSSLMAIGHPTELKAYGSFLNGVERVRIPRVAEQPGASAFWYLGRAGQFAQKSGADLLLLPAANRRATLSSPIPTVGVVHDLAQLHVSEKYDALRMFYVRKVIPRALRSARVLVSVSNVTANDVRDVVGIDGPPIRVVPNGVDFEKFRSAGPEDPRIARARKELKIAGPYVLYAARLEHPGKNHLRLIRAFARSNVRETHMLVLAGKNWGGEELIRGEIASHGLGSRVKLAGYVPDEHVPGLVGGAETVVMVGLYEGFGLPALEALAAGRPVCASRSGALPEVVGPHAVLCDPHDEDSIKESLERALLDAAYRARVATEGPQWASQHGWQRTIEGLLSACREAGLQ